MATDPDFAVDIRKVPTHFLLLLLLLLAFIFRPHSTFGWVDIRVAIGCLVNLANALSAISGIQMKCIIVHFSDPDQGH